MSVKLQWKLRSRQRLVLFICVTLQSLLVLPFGLIKFLNLMPLQTLIIYVVQKDFRVRSFNFAFPNFRGRDKTSPYLRVSFYLVAIGTLIAFWNGPALFEL
jgi:hypothetical protein